MIDRTNRTIESVTILNMKYLSIQKMEIDLVKFLIYYNLNRKHGYLGKELNVRNAYEMVRIKT